MSTWTLIQIVFDLFMACGLFVVVMRMNRAPKDDPRLSRGLALLQSKISVLEDLSDRTEAQVTSMIGVLESKAREVQAKVELADRHVAEIRVAMERSLEVASIFQDKIPHKEIIERQNTIKYVQAARLAHAGASVDEIATRVDLPRGELEFIASVNRERLMFSEDELPEWARGEGAAGSSGAGAGAGASAASGAGQATEGLSAQTATPAYATAQAQTPHAFAANAAQPGAMFGASMNGLSFDETAQAQAAEAAMTNEERARRLRAEIELTENQRLVENLSRLQAEMQNLDQQLARENTTRNTAAAYEVPKVETDHLKKLGEEFRRAVREGEAADAKPPFGGSGGSSFLPPLEKLSQLIPTILEAGAVDASARVSAETQPQPTLAQQFAQAQQQAMPTAQPTQTLHVSQVVQAAPQRAAAHQTPTPAAAKDPVLARAVAQAKVQAALRTGAKPSSVNRTANPELQQARAVARDLAGNVVPPAKPGEVRKVAFPRIDGSDL